MPILSSVTLLHDAPHKNPIWYKSINTEPEVANHNINLGVTIYFYCVDFIYWYVKNPSHFRNINHVKHGRLQQML